MDYYMERWTPEGSETKTLAHWFDCYDRAVGIAALHGCGVTLTYLTGGDVTFAVTTAVAFGNIREETA